MWTSWRGVCGFGCGVVNWTIEEADEDCERGRYPCVHNRPRRSSGTKHTEMNCSSADRFSMPRPQCAHLYGTDESWL
jgi:hypothetical protein